MIAVSALLVVGLSACSQKTENKDKKMKTLVAYFSATGVTRGIAQQLAEVAGADLHEITPQQPYTAADLDWTDKQSRSTIEMQDKNSRPAIADTVANMKDYDVVFVGFPIWWGREPSVVDTFLTAYDFSGKRIVPFCTSGGSDIGKTAERLKPYLPGDPEIVGAEVFHSADEAVAWAKGII